MKAAKKKVLFTSHTANFVKFNRPFMRMLKERGYEVHYASAGEEPVPDCDVHHTVPFERSPLKLGNVKAYRRLKRIIDQEKFSLIHTHTPMGSVVTRLAARDARRRGTRVIYTAHGFHFFKGAPLANWLIYYPIEKFTSLFTDTIVTINTEDLERSRNFYAGRVFKIPGVGVDLARFKVISEAKKNSLRKKHGFNQADNILIYLAELNKNKNQAFLVKQIAALTGQFPNVQLILCGVGDQFDALKALSVEFGVEDHVHLLGYRNDVEELLSMSDICVASSIREGLGINLVEAMATGLPIIASDNRGHREVFNSGSIWGSLYPQDNSKIFCWAVKDILSTPNKEYMRVSNAQNAESYSTISAVDAMEKIYESTLEKS